MLLSPRVPRPLLAALVALSLAFPLPGCGDASSTEEPGGAGGEASFAGTGGHAAGTGGQSAAGQGGAGSAGQPAAGGMAGSGTAGSGQAGSGQAGSGLSGGGQGGSAGSGQAGSGQAGSAGSGPAGNGNAGSGQAGSGQAGSGTAGSGTAGSGQAGGGQAGSGTAGGGQAGGGQAGSGQAGSGGQKETVFLDSYPLKAQFPEGGTYDPEGQAFYVGSLEDGSVHRIDASTGAESVLFTESAPGTWWTLGMDVDVARRRLWVCAMDDRSPSPRAGSIWIFDLVTGQRIANHALASAAKDATCTDVALTKDGQGYVGDREQGNLYKVGLDEGVSLFVSNPDLSASVVGQNSMVVLPDESALLSLIYLPSRLVRVDLKDKSVQEVSIDGTFYDLSLLAGADGMAYANGSAYVAFTSKIVRVTPVLGDWSQATAVALDVPGGMTDVVSTPGGLYLLNGQSVTFALGSTPDPFALVKFVDPF